MEWSSSCPCCGADSEDCFPGFAGACPVCGWENDPSAGENSPSTRNGGLSLDEARLNFRVFGSILLPVDNED